MAMPLHVSRCMYGIGALSYFLERCVCFFSRMLNTPPGVERPFEPVLTVERPIRTPLRYTCIVCCGMLTSPTTGPLGESCGFHQYSPALSVPVGLPVGVPLVCAEGFSTACAAVSRAIETARTEKNFMSD